MQIMPVGMPQWMVTRWCWSCGKFRFRKDETVCSRCEAQQADGPKGEA